MTTARRSRKTFLHLMKKRMGRTEFVVLLCIVGVGALVATYRSNERETPQGAGKGESQFNARRFGKEHSIIQEFNAEIKPLREEVINEILRLEEGKGFTKSSEFLAAGWVYDEAHNVFEKSLNVTYTPERSSFTFNDQYTIYWENAGESAEVNTIATLPSGEVNNIDEKRTFLTGLFDALIPQEKRDTLKPNEQLQRILTIDVSAKGIEFDERKPELEGASTLLSLPPVG